MKTMIRMCMFLFVITIGNVFAQSDDAAVKKTIDEMNQKFNKAMMSGDYKAIADMYADDAVSLPNNSPIWMGKNEILQGNKKDMVETGIKFSNASNKTLKILGTGDTRVEVGQFTVSVTMPKTEGPSLVHGKYVNVWQKQSDGTWKIQADIWNTDTNPTMQAGAKSKDDIESSDKSDKQ